MYLVEFACTARRSRGILPDEIGGGGSQPERMRYALINTPVLAASANNAVIGPLRSAPCEPPRGLFVYKVTVLRAVHGHAF